MESIKKILKSHRVVDYIIYLYIAVIFGLYPIIFDNKYFNITITRYKTFMISSFVFIGAIFIAYIASLLLNKKEEKLAFNSYFDLKWYEKPSFWMSAFFCSNLFALVHASDFRSAFTGEKGRYLGFFTIFVFALVFLAMGLRVRMHTALYMILAITSIWAHIIAICQHAGFDFLHLRDKVSRKTVHLFISTFGNINIYASFITMSLPIFICIFIFAKKLIYKLVSAMVIVSTGMVILVTNSDSVYLGIGAALVLIWFLAFKDGRITGYFAALVLLAVGYLINVSLNRFVIKKYKKVAGFSKKLDNPKLAIFVLTIAIIALILSLVLQNKLAKLDRRKSIITMLVAMAIMVVGVVAVGIKSGSSLFKFDDNWGNHRGFVWRISGEIYGDFPLSSKFFGNGNESVRQLTTEKYYDDMIELTKSVYDNCHNETLQYLLTTGIFGAISYLGLFFSTLIFILKNSKKNYLLYAVAAAITGYFAQANVCVSQPITTPFFFFFMALGVGQVRYMKMQELKLKEGETNDNSNS